MASIYEIRGRVAETQEPFMFRLEMRASANVVRDTLQNDEDIEDVEMEKVF